jgi:hypothetical protein
MLLLLLLRHLEEGQHELLELVEVVLFAVAQPSSVIKEAKGLV